MNSNPSLRRWWAIGGTLAILGVILTILACNRAGTPTGGEVNAAEKENAAARAWPLWGGTVQRNLVNLTETNIARDWSTVKDKEKNVLWSVDLGSKAYGGPTIGSGKIFIGTNNNRPRDKEIRGDKGVLMCF